MLESPKLGQYNTHSLTVAHRSSPATRDDAVEVVNEVKGVRDLVMVGFDFGTFDFENHLNLEFVYSPSLSGTCEVFVESAWKGANAALLETGTQD